MGKTWGAGEGRRSPYTRKFHLLLIENNIRKLSKKVSRSPLRKKRTEKTHPRKKKDGKKSFLAPPGSGGRVSIFEKPWRVCLFLCFLRIAEEDKGVGGGVLAAKWFPIGYHRKGNRVLHQTPMVSNPLFFYIYIYIYFPTLEYTQLPKTAKTILLCTHGGKKKSICAVLCLHSTVSSMLGPPTPLPALSSSFASGLIIVDWSPFLTSIIKITVLGWRKTRESPNTPTPR